MRVGGAGTRRVRRDGGASSVEYAGLIVLACLIVTGLIAAGLPTRVANGTDAAICRILTPDRRDCGSDGQGTADPGGESRALPAGHQSDEPQHGRPQGSSVGAFFRGLWHGVTSGDSGSAGNLGSMWSAASGLLKGAAGAVADAGADLARFGADLWDHPGQTISQMWRGFIDQMKTSQAPYVRLAKRQWASGHHVAALLTAGKGMVIGQQNATGLGNLYHTIVDDKTRQLWSSGG